jgi:oligopeptide transport system ATP-binding protein
MASARSGKLNKDLVVVQDLKKYFETQKGIFSRRVRWIRAVDGVSFLIKKGEVFGLVGESGCGKTTVGKLILGLIRPTAGKIYFDGRDLARMSEEELRRLRRRMGVVYQHPQSSLNPRMTVSQIVGRPLEIHGIAKGGEKEKIVLDVLKEVGLGPEHLDRFPHEFSGGQQQRIAIARVLVLKPDFVVLDEPTSMLDVSVQAHILNLLSDLREKFGFTYLLISHDLNVVEHMSDRIAVMYVGKIVELAPQSELRDNPLHPYTQSLLAAVPIPDPRYKPKGTVLRGEIPSVIDPPPGCRFHPRCPYAKPICREREPEFLDVENGHYVACHLVGA